MSNYVCTECGATVRIPRVVSTVTCQRCGDVSFCDGGVARRMYPALTMCPLGTFGGVESKWMPTHTRPVRSGLYECRFRDIEPRVIVLHWNGRHFTHCGEPVRMRHFLTWRGVLA